MLSGPCPPVQSPYRITMTESNYDWVKDSAECYSLAIRTLRETYLKERLPHELAKEWLSRTGRPEGSVD